MEPAKMKTHHGYFLGKPMSAVGTQQTFEIFPFPDIWHTVAPDAVPFV